MFNIKKEKYREGVQLNSILFKKRVLKFNQKKQLA